MWLLYGFKDYTWESEVSCRSLVNQDRLCLLSTVRKIKSYRRYYKELSKEYVHEQCLIAMKKYFSTRMYPDIVEMHIFAKAFHKSYRHAYAKERTNEEKD
jgi:hypothetical protein